MTKSLTPDQLETALRAVGHEQYHDKHPFQARMNSGDLTAPELRGWILNRFYYQQMIPIKDSLILAKLPSREERRRWIRRIVDHDGSEDGEGGIEAWLRLGEAAGISREEMTSTGLVELGVRSAVDDYVEFCRSHSWLEGVASSLTELFAPRLMADRMVAIGKHYPWVETWGLDYFVSRLDQAPRDARHALSLVTSYATAWEQQQAVIDALEFKCQVLWRMLDGIQARYSIEGSPSLLAGHRPALSAKARFRHEEVRNQDLLLLPERIVKLNRTATAVVQRCDGKHTLAEIAAELEATFSRENLFPQVERLVRRLVALGALR